MCSGRFCTWWARGVGVIGYICAYHSIEERFNNGTLDLPSHPIKSDAPLEIPLTDEEEGDRRTFDALSETTRDETRTRRQMETSFDGIVPSHEPCERFLWIIRPLLLFPFVRFIRILSIPFARSPCLALLSFRRYDHPKSDTSLDQPKDRNSR